MAVLSLWRRTAKGIAEVCVVVLITLALLEAALWLLASRNKSVAVMTASALTDTLPDAALGSRLNPEYPGHDRDGFRNAAVLDRADLVAIGDSQTYGTNVQMKQAWPQQIAALGGETVYNMGVPGYGPVHYLMLTPHALAKKPAWVVTALYDGNDLYDSFRMVYLQNQMTDMASKDAAVLAAVRKAQAAEPIEDTVDRLSKIYDGDFHPSVGSWARSNPSLKSRMGAAIKTYSKTWNLLRSIRRIVLEKGASSQAGLMGQMGWRSMKEKASASGGYWLPYENGDAKTIFVPSYRQIGLEMGDPRIEEGARISEEAMRRSDDEARAAQAKFAVLMVPTKELVFYEAFSGTGDATMKALSVLVSQEIAFREQFKRDVCDKGILCIDPVPALTDSLRKGSCPYPMDSDGHPNPIGHAILAEAVWKATGQSR